MLARSKLNSKKSKIFEALTNNHIIHVDFMTIISEEKTIESYLERMIKKESLE